ncbi:MAG: DEAD/DEAH box helicase family protein [Ignavibacteriales bacterium]|nr:DEAD/DEAH box helicase family protein [Ignavibacteriales bacterium]
MKQLYQAIAERTQNWHKGHYQAGEYKAIAEILEWAANPDGSGWKLRPPQLRALEVYWYLRLVENTPHIFDLYRSLFPPSDDPDALLNALGIDLDAWRKSKYNWDQLWEDIRANDDFVREFKLQALRETLTLDYPSYILALAMGAGKTALIGAIIATEFGMAMEHPSGPFVQNALIFAPGKTIIESLRQLAEIPYGRILPERIFKQFAASLKMTFTRDGDPDIPIIDNSIFNLVVTNTEKIRIQKETIRKADIGNLFGPPEKEDEARSEVANRRLRKIASLPHLAVFSDEAHHTYGQALDSELKKVRKTVDYLHKESPNLICVVNTTGTPYFQRHLLRDVVMWYGLSEGIHDGILKEVANNIRAYELEGNVENYVTHVISDFFAEYGNVTLPDGTPAKMAMYFPQTDDVTTLRPVIEMKLAELGLPSTLLLEHHTRSEHKTEFDRFRFKDSPHRVALLVDRGVEGWDVPALFSCALARALKGGSNSFVLQAACRCLRQVPGNTKSARIYLSMENRAILDRQLQETFGETLADLDNAHSKSVHTQIRLRKLKIPPLVVRQEVKTIVRKETKNGQLVMEMPVSVPLPTMTVRPLTIAEQNSSHAILVETGTAEIITTAEIPQDVYSAAVDIALQYHLDVWDVYDELRRLYANDDVPAEHLLPLQKQVERQTCTYEVKMEIVERALALVKPEGFDKAIDDDGTEVYTAEISYPIAKEHLLAPFEKWKETAKELAFHYTPYNFDSTPEMTFFEGLLRELNTAPEEIEDIYFTGAITDPKKTDFYVEYRGEDEQWHRYTPDFVIRKKNGKCLIVEVKDERFKNAINDDLKQDSHGKEARSIEGRKAIALKKYEHLDPSKLKYEIVYAHEETVSSDQLAAIAKEVKEL